MAADKSYIGVGSLHVRPFGSVGKRRFMGNCSVATVKQDVEIKKQKDYTRVGGGTVNQVERLTAVSLEITLLEFDAANLALATAGTTTAMAAATITDEVFKSYKDSLVRLSAPPNLITTVKNNAGTTTFVAGTDYVLSPGGLYITPGSTMVDAADHKVTYTNLAYDRIEAATATANELEIFIEGLNEAESSRPVLVDCWRVRLPPASELALLGEDFGELKFTAELLKDGSKGAGLSAYMRVQKV